MTNEDEIKKPGSGWVNFEQWKHMTVLENCVRSMPKQVIAYYKKRHMIEDKTKLSIETVKRYIEEAKDKYNL